MVFRLTELYASIQGEGPRVGQPTVFVRFGGCNLRCPGWPCDTQYAIDPKYRDEWERLEWEVLYDRIMDFGIKNICLTGGEPFLQPKGGLQDLVGALLKQGCVVEAFSNGTLAYPEWAIRKVLFTMDWKLPGSGENPHSVNRYQNIRQFAMYPETKQAVKFVVKDRADFDMAIQLYNEHLAFRKNILVYTGRVWSDDPNELTDSTLAQWMLDEHLPWRLNVQMHNHIWNREQRGI